MILVPLKRHYTWLFDHLKYNIYEVKLFRFGCFLRRHLALSASIFALVGKEVEA